jgi:hypothetical protein
VEALKELINDFTGIKIEAIASRYETGMFDGIIISAVDSMSTRKTIWDNHKDKSVGTKCLIDPRMGAETALMYVMSPMDGTDQVSYEKTLYTDESALQERCTAKATMYTACMLSGLVAKAVKDIVTNSNYPRVSMWSIKDDDFKVWKKI